MGCKEAFNKQLFFSRQRRTFFTAKGRFFYRRGGCRHARHDGGDGGDGKEENSFSDCRHRQPRQGEADSHAKAKPTATATAFCIYFIPS